MGAPNRHDPRAPGRGEDTLSVARPSIRGRLSMDVAPDWGVGALFHAFSWLYGGVLRITLGLQGRPDAGELHGNTRT
jgi:hypothetical protein